MGEVKKIVVVWVETVNDPFYDREMRVVYSTHERFVKGTRFDFGYMTIAGKDGYIVEVLP